jgi:hypothetical protein
MVKDFIYIIGLILVLCCSFIFMNGDVVIIDDPEDVGVYAYLNKSTTTSCDVADTWYPVEGVFINEPIEAFYLNLSIPGIVYNSTTPRYILVETIASISPSVNGVTVTGKIVKNNETDSTGGNPSTLLKYNDEIYSFSGNEILYMEKGDYLTIEIKCDRSADINFIYITSDIQKFFD